MIKFSQRKSSKAGEVNLTPMIDIIFNLLIFFLIVAVISKGSQPDPSKNLHGGKRPEKSLEITVTEDKRILFDGEVVQESEVEERLRDEKAKAQGEKADNILLKADVEAPFGMFVKVMDTARKVGLTNLVIATKQKPEKAGEDR